MHLRRLLAPKYWKTGKKTAWWVVTPRPGPHPKSFSIPLLVLVRDVLKLAEKAKEAKYIIKRKKILIDWKPRTDHKFPVGFMDVVAIPELKKFYRITASDKGLEAREISKEDAKKKILKVVRKQKVKGGRIQLTTHDGRNFLDIDAKPGDSLLCTIDEKTGSFKVEKVLKLAPGAVAFVFKGRRAGRMGKIKEIKPRIKEAVLVAGQEEFEAPLEYLIVVGEEKPEVQVYGKE